MKRVLLLLLLAICFYPNTASCQTKNCTAFKNGTFTLTDNGKTTVITRSGSVQTEVYDNSDKKTSYKVTWLNDCTYLLTPNQDVFDKYPGTPKDALLTVSIISTTANSYTQTCKFNFAENTFTAEVIKIK